MSHTPKILFNLFHPDLSRSRGNRIIAHAVQKLANLTLNDVYAAYPDGNIDVEREQRLLLENDVIVFQHPLYWFSGPWLMKKWQDEVLKMGFAYPPGEGDQLRGKRWLSSITAGGPWEAYRSGGYNGFTISELLRPMQQCAAMCQMQWLPAFALHSVLPEGAQGFRNVSTAGIEEHAGEICRYLESLTS